MAKRSAPPQLWRQLQSSKKKKTVAAGRAALMLEPLEDRAFLSANITSAISDVSVNHDAAPTVVDLNPAGTLVRFNTTQGNFFVQLYDAAAPISVANFLSYVNSNSYAADLIHRSDQNSSYKIIQGGGFFITTTNNVDFVANDVVTSPPIALEFGLPNTRGTLAMARTSVQDSATSGFFFNNADNTAVFNAGNPYAVFGATVFGNNTVVDAIAALPVFDYSGGNSGSAFSTVPLSDWTQDNYSNDSLSYSHLVLVNNIQVASGVTFTVTANSNPALVTPSIDNNKQLHLTYASGVVGLANITVRMADSTGAFVEDTFSVHVTGVDAQPDSATVRLNTPVVIPILDNDTTTDGTLIPASVAIAVSPQHGTTQIDGATGDITYTPDNDFVGSDSFAYTVASTNGITSSSTAVSIHINRAPVATNDTAAPVADSPFFVRILANDTDPDGELDPTTVVIVDQPDHGTAVADPVTGVILYTPNQGYVGADSFSYHVSDNDGEASNDATVSLNIQTLATILAGSITSPLADVSVLRGASPTLTNLNSGGTVVRFDSTLGSFFVQLYDDRAPLTVANFLHYVTTNAYTSNIIQHVDQNNSFKIVQAGTYPISSSNGVDFAIGDALTGNAIAMEFNLPNTRGTLAMARDNADPDTADTAFFFNNADNSGFFNATNPYAVFGATVFGNNSVIDAIAALPIYDFGSAFGQTPLANYSQADYTNGVNVGLANLILYNKIQVATGLTFTVRANSNPALVTPAIVNNQLQLTYAPNAVGQSTLTVRMTDSTGAFVEDTFDVSVAGVVTGADSAATRFNTPVTLNVLANDTASGGTIDATTVAAGTGPQHGALGIDPDTGAITYTPTSGFSGDDSFTYTVTDSNSHVSAATTVNVHVNAPPTASNDSATAFVNSAVSVAVLANDTDPDGTVDAASIVIVDQPDHGTVSINPTTHAILYTPDHNYLGADSFTYHFSDNSGDASNDAAVSLNVQTLSVTIGVGGAKQVSYTDADNTAVVIKVAKSTAQVSFSGDDLQVVTTSKGTTLTGTNIQAVAIDITGATIAGTLTFTGKGGNGQIDLTNITADGDFKSITGKMVNLLGDLTATGGVKTITLGSLQNAALTIGASADPAVALALSLAGVTGAVGSSLTSGVAIKSIAAAQWIKNGGDSLITAPSLGTLTFKGNFDADVNTPGDIKGITVKGNASSDSFTARMVKALSVTGNLTGSTLHLTQSPDINNPKLTALGKMAVKGFVDGVDLTSDNSIGTIAVTGALRDSTWSVTGDGGAITAGSTQDWSAIFSGDVTGLTIKGDASTTFTARMLKALSVTGNLTDSTLDLTQAPDANNPKLTALGKMAVKGLVDGLGLTSANSIGAVSVTGSLNDSNWDITGDAAGLTIKGNASDATFAARVLKALTVNGNLTDSAFHLTLVPDANNPKLTALGKMTVKGVVDGLDLRSDGNVGAVTVGAAIDSTFFAGVDPNVEELPSSAGQLAQQAGIASFKIAGVTGLTFDLVNSIIAAANIGPVTLLLPNLDNGGDPYGVAAQTIKSVSYKDANATLKLDTPDEYATLIPVGDLTIRIL
ncbi:MAG: tandem-95 repeat protein [Planctomycetes bacterium]|nr:tandem-95 repeat protein [Planctomycetota bacterium]